jgi:hypothetical protein
LNETFYLLLIALADYVAALWWEWIPSSQRTLAHPDTTHTCRNFEKIWQWAADHEMKGDFNSYVHVLEED